MLHPQIKAESNAASQNRFDAQMEGILGQRLWADKAALQVCKTQASLRILRL
jgi:hypothetical protein